jgi:dephospho-CoA kinase
MLSREDVINRMQSQMDPNQKIKKADYVIVNDASKDELIQSSKKVYYEIICR